MRRPFSSLALLVCLPAAAWAEDPPAARPIVVARPVTIGLDQSAGDTFADLVRTELARQGSMAPITASSTPPTPCGDPTCGAQIAQQTGQDLVVVMTLSQLGQLVIVKVTVADNTGRPLFDDRVTGARVEDLEPLAPRVASAIATRQPIADTATVSTVTEQEAKEPVRKKALFTSGARFGGYLPVADAFGGAGLMSDFGLFGMYEFPSFGVILDMDFQWSRDSEAVKVFGFGSNIGFQKFLSPESPTGTYLGGGFGFRFISADIESSGSFGADACDSGLGFYASGGVVFLRTADIHIVADVRYDVNLFQLDGLGKNEKAHGVMATLGFSYSKGLKGLFGR